jgi:heme oxygenase (mycobilin-producing)
LKLGELRVSTHDVAISRINDFYAARGREGELREFLLSVIATIKSAPGCLSVELLVDHDDAAHLVVFERWQDVASHQAAAKVIPPSQLAQVQSLIAAPSKGHYYDPM